MYSPEINSKTKKLFCEHIAAQKRAEKAQSPAAVPPRFYTPQGYVSNIAVTGRAVAVYLTYRKNVFRCAARVMYSISLRTGAFHRSASLCVCKNSLLVHVIAFSVCDRNINKDYTRKNAPCQEIFSPQKVQTDRLDLKCKKGV